MIAIDWLNDWMTHNNDQGVTDTTLHRTQTYNRLYRSDYNYDVHDVEYKCLMCKMTTVSDKTYQKARTAANYNITVHHW